MNVTRHPTGVTRPVGLFAVVLVGLAVAALDLAGGSASGPAYAQPVPATPPAPPTERIDVEQAVAFPYDI